MLKYSIVSEKKRLKSIAADFSMGTGFTSKMEKYMTLTIKKDVKNGEILDVGCADGIMVQMIAKYFKHFTAIDGSKKLIGKAKSMKLANVDFIHTLFEEFKPRINFDTIILSDILEHIHDPVSLLKKCRIWLKNNGVVLIISPNAFSLHRRIGTLASILKDEHSLNETDIKVGHKRVYDIDMLKKDIQKAGLKVNKVEGIFLKPLPDAWMNQLDKKVIDAFYLIGKVLPAELMSLIYIKCTK